MLSIIPVVGPLVAPIVKNQYFPDTSMPMVSELAQLWSANKVEDPEKRKESIEKALINMGFRWGGTWWVCCRCRKGKIYKSLTKRRILGIFLTVLMVIEWETCDSMGIRITNGY